MHKSNPKLYNPHFFNIKQWKTHGVVPIIRKNNLFSCNFRNPNLFISNPFQLNYNGGCSLVAEFAVVVRAIRVRFSASTLFEKNNDTIKSNEDQIRANIFAFSRSLNVCSAGEKVKCE